MSPFEDIQVAEPPDHPAPRQAEQRADVAGAAVRAGTPRHRGTGPRRSRWRGYSRRLLLAVVFITGVRTFVGEASVVPTGSMQSTVLIGDHIFLDKLLYGPEVPLLNWRLPSLKAVGRGDIVVFRFPKDPSQAFIKRVIAVSGDRLEIRDGAVYLNSRRIAEPYAVHERPRSAAREQLAPLIVPPHCLFVMGDNRDNSSDSREWGFVPVENVIAEPLFVYWSYDAPSSRWLNKDLGQEMAFYASIAGNFFSRTRWERTGMLL